MTFRLEISSDSFHSTYFCYCLLNSSSHSSSFFFSFLIIVRIILFSSTWVISFLSIHRTPSPLPINASRLKLSISYCFSFICSSISLYILFSKPDSSTDSLGKGLFDSSFQSLCFIHGDLSNLVSSSSSLFILFYKN